MRRSSAEWLNESGEEDASQSERYVRVMWDSVSFFFIRSGKRPLETLDENIQKGVEKLGNYA